MNTDDRTGHAASGVWWDRLSVLRIGAGWLAVPLSEVVYYAQASEQRKVADGPFWMTGVLADRATGAWLPVIHLALLWDDPSLGGRWSRVVVTRGGLAIGATGFTRTREAVPIIPLRPPPRHPALGQAAMLDGRPVPVLDTAHLLSPAQWASLTAGANT